MSVQDKVERTVLHYAIEFYLENIKLMIDTDVNVIIKNNREYIALDMTKSILKKSYTSLNCEKFIKKYNKMLRDAHEVLL